MTQRTTPPALPADIRYTAVLFIADSIRRAMAGERIESPDDLSIAIKLVADQEDVTRDVGLLAMKLLTDVVLAQIAARVIEESMRDAEVGK